MGLSWTWQYTGELFLCSRVGYQQQRFDVGPQSCEWDPGQLHQHPGRARRAHRHLCGRTTPARTIDRPAEAAVHRHRRVHSRTAGCWAAHGLKLDLELLRGDEQRRPLDRPRRRRHQHHRAACRSPARTYCSNDPKLANGECRKNYLRSSIVGDSPALSLSDSWKPTRYLTITPAVSLLIGQLGERPGRRGHRHRRPSLPRLLGHLGRHPRRQAPSCSASFRGIGRHRLPGAGLASPAGRCTSQRLLLGSRGHGLRRATAAAQGGNDTTTVGLPCGPDRHQPRRHALPEQADDPAGLGGDRSAASARSDHRHGAGATLFIYRKFLQPVGGRRDQRQLERAAAPALDRSHPFKSGRTEFIFDLQTPDEATPRIPGGHRRAAQARGRGPGAAQLHLSRFQGSTEALTGTFLDNPGQTKFYYGPLAADNPPRRARPGGLDRQVLAVGGHRSSCSCRARPTTASSSIRSTGASAPTGPSAAYDNRGNAVPRTTTGRCACRTSRSWTCRCGSAWSRSSSSGSTSGSTPSTCSPCAPPPAVVQTDGPFWGQVQSRQAPLQLRFGAQFRF